MKKITIVHNIFHCSHDPWGQGESRVLALADRSAGCINKSLS